MEQHQDVDRVLKIVLIGASGVGKTSIIQRFGYDSKPVDYKSTIGVDFVIKKLQVNGHLVKCQVWDTAGQEKFLAITRSYFKNADAIFACFDPKKKETLEYVVNQYLGSQEMDLAKPDAYKVFVATKGDLNPMKEMASSDMLEQIEATGVPMIWTSAMNNENIEDLFKGACAYCLENTTRRPRGDSFVLPGGESQKEKEETKQLTNSCC